MEVDRDIKKAGGVRERGGRERGLPKNIKIIIDGRAPFSRHGSTVCTSKQPVLRRVCPMARQKELTLGRLTESLYYCFGDFL